MNVNHVMRFLNLNPVTVACTALMAMFHVRQFSKTRLVEDNVNNNLKKPKGQVYTFFLLNSESLLLADSCLW